MNLSVMKFKIVIPMALVIFNKEITALEILLDGEEME